MKMYLIGIQCYILFFTIFDVFVSERVEKEPCRRVIRAVLRIVFL